MRAHCQWGSGAEPRLFGVYEQYPRPNTLKLFEFRGMLASPLAWPGIQSPTECREVGSKYLSLTLRDIALYTLEQRPGGQPTLGQHAEVGRVQRGRLPDDPRW